MIMHFLKSKCRFGFLEHDFLILCKSCKVSAGATNPLQYGELIFYYLFEHLFTDYSPYSIYFIVMTQWVNGCYIVASAAEIFVLFLLQLSNPQLHTMSVGCTSLKVSVSHNFLSLQKAFIFIRHDPNNSYVGVSI